VLLLKRNSMSAKGKKVKDKEEFKGYGY